MESTSKFNLEKSLAQWKNSLRQDDSLTEDTIAELESHLLDETDELRAKGLDEEEAFFVARKRLGNTGILISEFEKIDDNILSFNRVRFFVVGILFSYFLTYFIQTISVMGGMLSFYFFQNEELATTAIVIMLLVTISIISLMYYRLLLIRKVKSLGIFSNILFLTISIVVCRLFNTFIIPFGGGIYASHYTSYLVAQYFSIALLLFILSVSLFIHFKARRKRTVI